MNSFIDFINQNSSNVEGWSVSLVNRKSKNSLLKIHMKFLNFIMTIKLY